MKRTEVGRYQVTDVGGELVEAFVPEPLPPTPPVDLSSGLTLLQEEAAVALGRLDAATSARTATASSV